MNRAHLPQLRLQNHRLTNHPFKTPAEVVGWLGAVQSQDYTGAKWALGLRMHGAHDSEIDQAFDDGTILRTHILRPTWHFVLPADIRWIQKLTAPHVHVVNSTIYKRMGLDASIIKRSRTLLTKILRDQHYLTRDELGAHLEKNGIAQKGLGLAYIVMHAELEGILCSGPRRGKQFTYALLDERAPQTPALTREQALAELTKRYLTSHGPATVQDYSKWSGLKISEARRGIELVKAQFIQATIDGKTYWFPPNPKLKKEKTPIAYLLSNYDEYFSGYADHSLVIDPAHANQFELLYPHSIVLDGRVAGVWRRVFTKDGLVITPKLFRPFTAAETHALTRSASQYSKFLEMPVSFL
ncbi:MAG TPA: winged helix DNA-binding domain-containing protein [Anaerolineae bacterium]|nr:winged helix DNA-binding domain-containing protein [Anaerolineae bacterium]